MQKHILMILNPVQKNGIQGDCKVENFHMVKELLRLQDWFVKVEHASDPCSSGPSQICSDSVAEPNLPVLLSAFSLSCAPKVFTKLTKPVMVFLKERKNELKNLPLLASISLENLRLNVPLIRGVLF